MSTEKNWIQTYTGRRFYPLDPNPADIEIEDIAHGLALQCRFTGQCREFYSVAQHSLIVAALVDRPEDRLWALLHDAPEAYMADVSRPIKHSPMMQPYRDAEAALQRAVAQRFGLPPEIPESVHRADKLTLAIEAHEVLTKVPDWLGAWDLSTVIPGRRIVPLSWRQAEKAFLEEFVELAR